MDIAMPMSGTVQKGKVKATSKISKHSGKNELWPEEIQALKDNRTGKAKMKKQSGKEFLRDLEKIVNG
jgi:hypothetical protein